MDDDFFQDAFVEEVAVRFRTGTAGEVLGTGYKAARRGARGPRPVDGGTGPNLSETIGIVPGTLQNGVVYCKAPRNPAVTSFAFCREEFMTVDVAMDGHTFQGSCRYRYFRDPRLKSLELRRGPASGGTLLGIHLFEPIMHPWQSDRYLIRFKSLAKMYQSWSSLTFPHDGGRTDSEPCSVVVRCLLPNILVLCLYRFHG